jgi:hypothetical protein
MFNHHQNDLKHTRTNHISFYVKDVIIERDEISLYGCFNSRLIMFNSLLILVDHVLNEHVCMVSQFVFAVYTWLLNNHLPLRWFIWCCFSLLQSWNKRAFVRVLWQDTYEHRLEVKWRYKTLGILLLFL